MLCAYKKKKTANAVQMQQGTKYTSFDLHHPEDWNIDTSKTTTIMQQTDVKKRTMEQSLYEVDIQS